MATPRVPKLSVLHASKSSRARCARALNIRAPRRSWKCLCANIKGISINNPTCAKRRVVLSNKSLNGSGIEASLSFIPTPNSYSASAPLQKKYYIQRHIRIPNFPEVDIGLLQYQYPELACGLTPSFVRDVLDAEFATSMWEAVVPTERAGLPPSLWPTTLTKEKPDTSIITPTHMLSFTEINREGYKTTLYPVHDLMLAANCSRVPALPYSSARNSSSCTHIPVFPLTVPYPKNWHILQVYLYRKDDQQLEDYIFPPEKGDEWDAFQTLTTINEVYQNACALQFVDIHFYQVLGLYWVKAATVLEESHIAHIVPFPFNFIFVGP